MEPIQPDHLILGCRDLDSGIAYAEVLCGYRAVAGGSHPGKGTRNALLKLGERCYLEILAPDPEQPKLTWFRQIARLSEPRLVGWAAAVKNIEKYATELRSTGTPCLGPDQGSRTNPNGEVFRWKTLVLEDDRKGLLPFYIEWAPDLPHPATTAPGACLFRSIYRTGQIIEAPAPGPDFHRVTIPHAPLARLHVVVAGLFGEFELTSEAIPSEAWERRT